MSRLFLSPYTYGRVLGASAVGWSHTGDTAETKLATVTVPANTVGLGQLEVVTLWQVPNNGNNKTLTIRYGAANDLSGTQYFTTTQTTIVSYQDYRSIRNITNGTQVGMAGGATVFGASSSALVTSSVDTTAASYVVFSCTCGSSADTITLKSYLVRLVPGV